MKLTTDEKKTIARALSVVMRLNPMDTEVEALAKKIDEDLHGKTTQKG